MELRETIEKAKEEVQSVINLELSSVSGVSKTEAGWRLTVEMIERKSIPDAQDLLGVYEVLLDEQGHMTSYERIRVRRRIDAEERLE
jgi:hypothetical protein